MASRDLTISFTNKRNIVTNFSFDENSFFDSLTIPYFMVFKEQWELHMASFDQSIGELKQHQEDHLHHLSHLSTENTSYLHAIESKTLLLKSLFVVASQRLGELEEHQQLIQKKRLVKQLDPNSIMYPRSYDILIHNLKQQCANELEHHYKAFKASQTSYLDQYDTIQSKILDYHANYEIDEDEEEEALLELQERIHDSAELAYATSMREDVIRRHADLKALFKQTMDIHDVATNIHEVIIERGSLLDRVDVQLERSSVYIQHANKKMVSAEKKQRARICCFFIFLLLLMLCLVFAGIFVKLGIEYGPTIAKWIAALIAAA
mmetsp:Transcript_5285/g.7799  ORF Transcript_5285/g.7799 Transcript_5285/m.7799 type:complete len:321 (+) Transcript_5285:1976-2938(+)